MARGASRYRPSPASPPFLCVAGSAGPRGFRRRVKSMALAQLNLSTVQPARSLTRARKRAARRREKLDADPRAASRCLHPMQIQPRQTSASELARDCSRPATVRGAQRARRSETVAQASEESTPSLQSGWSQTTCGDTVQRPAISASNTCMSMGDGRTIGPRIRISRPDGRSARCNPFEPWLCAIPLNPRRRLHHFQRPTPSHVARSHRMLRAAAMSTWREVVAAA